VLILLSLKLMAYALLSVLGNASCVIVPNINGTMINMTVTSPGFNITHAIGLLSNVTLFGNYAEEFMRLGGAYCEGSFGKMYIVNGGAYLINSTSGGLIVGVSSMLNVSEVSIPCITVPVPAKYPPNSTSPLINLPLIPLVGCLAVVRFNGTVVNSSMLMVNYTSLNLMLSALTPITFRAILNGVFNTYTYGSGAGAGNALPTSVLLIVKSPELVARVKSSIPVYLRFYVFDNVTRGYSLNYTLKPIVNFINSPYTLSMYTGNTTDCRLINVTVYFIHPESVIPIPIPVNEGGRFLVARYVEVKYTNPSSTLLLIEPGKVLLVSNPVSEVGYSVDVCSISGAESRAINDPYALLYRYTVAMPISVNSSNPLEASLIILRILQNRTIQAKVSSFFNSTWGPSVASAVAMYLYRALGYPARVILGTVPIKYDGEYLEYGYLPWVEFYYGGWVDFKPYRGLPTSSSGGGLGELLTRYGVNYVGVSVLLVLPALLIYYLYLYLTSRGVYGE